MKTAPLTKTVSVLAALLAFGVTRSLGAAGGTDNAADAVYNDSWTTGDNGGTGLNPWVLTNTGTAGFFIGNSAGNGSGSSGNINTSGESWGTFANSGGLASAVRSFTTGGSNGQSFLGNGETFSLRLDNGFIQAGGTVGFGLQDSAGVNRFEFFFAGGGSGYTVSGSVNQTTTHGFSADGLTALFTLTGVNTYSFDVTYNTGSPTTENFTGTLKGTAGAGIDRVRLFNANAGAGGSNDAFFNSITVVPEPTSLGLLGASLVGLAIIRRRRR